MVPEGQTLPHAPQLAGSVASEVHESVAGQCVWPATGQRHTDETQLVAAEHVTPHPPQLNSSLVRSTHVPVAAQ